MEPIVLYNIRKYHEEYISFTLDVEAKAKGIADNEKNIIQNMIVSKMKMKSNFKKFDRNIPLAINIKTHTCSKETVKIEDWVKNLLDLLHKELYKGDVDYNYLPFVDDDQIKYLNVEYFYYPDEDFISSTSTSINIIPYNSFLKDIIFLNKNDENLKIEEYTEQNFSFQEMKELQQLAEKKEPGYYLDKDGNKSISKSSFNNTFYKFYRTGYQAEVLSNEILNYDFFKFFSSKKLLRTFLNIQKCIKLPGVPLNITKNKEIKAAYKQEIFNIATSYKEKYSYIFDKLSQPLKLIVLYQPNYEQKHLKDIDNIVRTYIIQTMASIFQPPATLSRIKELEKEKGKPLKISLASSLNNQFIGYEFLLLPKDYSNKNGSVYIFLTKQNVLEQGILLNNKRKIEKIFEENKIPFHEGFSLK